MVESSPVQMAYILLFIQNKPLFVGEKSRPVSLGLLRQRKKKNLAILQGEKPYAPDAATLVGGTLDESENPLQALDREIKEELGTTTKPQNLTEAFAVTCPYNDTTCTLHIFTGEITRKQLRQTRPEQGRVVVCNLDNIGDDPLARDDGFISAMHHHVIQTYKENGNSGEHYTRGTAFPTIKQLQQQFLKRNSDKPGLSPA